MRCTKTSGRPDECSSERRLRRPRSRTRASLSFETQRLAKLVATRQAVKTTLNYLAETNGELHFFLHNYVSERPLPLDPAVDADDWLVELATTPLTKVRRASPPGTGASSLALCALSLLLATTVLTSCAPPAANAWAGIASWPCARSCYSIIALATLHTGARVCLCGLQVADPRRSSVVCAAAAAAVLGGEREVSPREVADRLMQLREHIAREMVEELQGMKHNNENVLRR